MSPLLWTALPDFIREGKHCPVLKIPLYGERVCQVCGDHLTLRETAAQPLYSRSGIADCNEEPVVYESQRGTGYEFERSGFIPVRNPRPTLKANVLFNFSMRFR